METTTPFALPRPYTLSEAIYATKVLLGLGVIVTLAALRIVTTCFSPGLATHGG